MVTLGVDNLLGRKLPWRSGARVGLLCNQASVTSRLVHTRILLKEQIGDDLCCLFSPQHGFYGEKQDNMIESGNCIDEATGVDVFSLYGDTRKPTDEMFNKIDVLVIDLVDVGTRVYTFMYTMAYCLEAAARLGKRVVVLDRPNPVGGLFVEGNILNRDYASFVGLYPLPMRHGLTFGELATYINREQDIDADLEIIAMKGWKRSMFFRDTGLSWVFPSPNMPTPETAMVYPGQVLWEGTTASEGRGTAMPFELTGAPYWQHEPIREGLSTVDLPGCCFRPLVFEPTSGKHAGEQCVGFYLHVTDPHLFKPYRTSLTLFQVVYMLYPEHFSYKAPPYEYEFNKLPMDLILGDRDIRKKLEQGVMIEELEEGWKRDLDEFDLKRRKYFLY